MMRPGALYMTLLWQAEKNFPGAIAVERALAQGEGKLEEKEVKPEETPFSITSTFSAFTPC
jgi:hypothetical protein